MTLQNHNLPLDLHVVQKGWIWHFTIIFSPFLTFDLHFLQEGCIWNFKTGIFTVFFRCFRLTFKYHNLVFSYIRPSFRVKRICSFNIAVLHQFLTFDLHVVRKGNTVTQNIRISPMSNTHDPCRELQGTNKNRISPHVCASDTHDLHKGLRQTPPYSRFNTQSCIRHSVFPPWAMFGKPVFGCFWLPLQPWRMSYKNLRSTSFVGIQATRKPPRIQFLCANSCVTPPAR